MIDTTAACRQLMQEFTSGYMEKLFYFCLKKTGSRVEAEDLTSDIALNVLNALQRGTIPASFPAWVWQIARNRYSVWSERKHRYSTRHADADISDFEIADDDPCVLDDLIHDETLALLRRELAFISSDYRNIVVAYYLEDRSVRDIASSLNLPEGTVMSRLHRARKILKEGMSMVRTFGKLSYKPEDIAFIMNGGDGKFGEPGCYLGRKLSKNILLAAYRTPSTAEELALELGVALPYMEEELTKLVEATLMKKNGGKYETNLFIVSASAQEKVVNHLLSITAQMTQAIINALEYETAWLNENCPGWHEGYQPYEDMKWVLLLRKVDSLSRAVIDSVAGPHAHENGSLGPFGHTIRPNGGEWDLLGLETHSAPRPCGIGCHSAGSTPEERQLAGIDFQQYKIYYRNIAAQTPEHLTYLEAQTLQSFACGDTEGLVPEILARLTDYGYIEKTSNGYRPTILVRFQSKTHPMPPEVQTEYDRRLNRARELACGHYQFCRDLIYQEIPDFLRDDFHQIRHACANLFSLRGAVLEEALRTGYITYSDDDPRRMLGAMLTV